jgi:hypothetical protein
MKLIDRSPIPVKPEGLDVATRIRGTMKYGPSWPEEIRAQESCAKILKRYLNDRYTLLLNLELSDLEVPIPMVLVGPVGVLVLYVSAMSGAFRAHGEDWLVLQTGRGYKPTRPNLILRTFLMARAVEVYLKRKDFSVPEIQGVLLFMNPRAFVETIRPMVRVVMSDAVEKLVTSLTQGQPVFDSRVVEAIVDALANPVSEQPPAEPTVPAPPPPPKPSRLKQFIAQFNFSRGQWLTLLILSMVLACVLLSVIVVVAMSPYY